jgi:hypothetical protein
MKMLNKIFVVTSLLASVAGAHAVNVVLNAVVNDTGKALYLNTEKVPGAQSQAYISGVKVEPQAGVLKKVNIPLDFTQGDKVAQFIIDDGINKDNKLRLVVLKDGNDIIASLWNIGYFTEQLGETKTFNEKDYLLDENPINLVVYVKGADLKGSYLLVPHGEYTLSLTK